MNDRLNLSITMISIPGNHLDDAGHVIEHMVGQGGSEFMEVARRGNGWVTIPEEAPVKAIRTELGTVHIVDATSQSWDGPVFGGTFSCDEGAAERAGMIEAV